MTKKIPLTKGRVALIDDADYECINQHKWTLHNKGYAYRHICKGPKTIVVLMHRMILGAAPGCEVDHINGNKLDNRRCNLRLCTRSQNSANRGKQRNNKTGYKGVYMGRRGFIAQILFHKVVHYLGQYPTAEEAARVYDQEAVKYFGEFALTNFPNES